MHSRFLLGGDLEVNRLGYGAMRLCGQPGNFGPYPDWKGGIDLLRRAVELGVELIDTAYAYGPGNNEELIAEALEPFGGSVVVATKGGVEKTAPDRVFPNGRPEALRRSCEGSLKRLRVERIDLYQLHRPDPEVPFLESVGALAQLRAEGKIRHVGLSNVTLAQIEEAAAIVPVASVQNRFHFRERQDEATLRHCEERGIAYFPWGPLGAKPFEAGAPLARGGGGLEEVAGRYSVTPSQMALAWLMRCGRNVLPIPGTTCLAHLEENMAAAALEVRAEDLESLESLESLDSNSEAEVRTP
jgi:pyridoxine 4-dehydrogenase